MMASSGPVSGWVVAELGAIRLGIAVGAVIGAMQRPPVSGPLGRRNGAVCQVVTYQGNPVPVIDLALWLPIGAPTQPRGAQLYVLMLRHDARTIGILVDNIEGVVSFSGEAVVRLHHDESAEEIFHSIAFTDSGAPPVSLLDVSRLMALALIWSSSIPLYETDVQPESEPIPNGTNQKWAVLESCGRRFAVCAVDVGELLTMPKMERLPGSGMAGICLWRGRHVPVLDSGTLFAAPSAQGAPKLLLTLCREGLALGLAVDRIVHLRQIRVDTQAQALPSEIPTFVQAILLDDGVPLYVINTRRLLAEFREASMSRVERVNIVEAKGHSNIGSYIIYRADSIVASPICGLEAVLEAESHTGTIIEWRGMAVPVLDLRGNSEVAGNVLVLRHDGRLTALLVERIESLVTPNAGRLSEVKFPGEHFEMLTTGHGRHQASYRVLDLGKFATERLSNTTLLKISQ